MKKHALMGRTSVHQRRCCYRHNGCKPKEKSTTDNKANRSKGAIGNGSRLTFFCYCIHDALSIALDLLPLMIFH